MIRTHKPRGYLWNCATPFQQTPEIRNIQYRDCVPPAANVLAHDEYRNLPADERAAKRRRVEQLADDFLSGKSLEIQSAKLPTWVKRYPHSRQYSAPHSGPSVFSDRATWQDELDDWEVLRAESRPERLGDQAAPADHSAQLYSRQRQVQSSLPEGLTEVHAQAACRSGRNHGHGQDRPAIRDSGSDWTDDDHGSITSRRDSSVGAISDLESSPEESNTLSDNPPSSPAASKTWFHRRGEGTSGARVVLDAENIPHTDALKSSAVRLPTAHTDIPMAVDQTLARAPKKQKVYHRKSGVNSDADEQMRRRPPTPRSGDTDHNDGDILVSSSPFVYRPRSAGKVDSQHEEWDHPQNKPPTSSDSSVSLKNVSADVGMLSREAVAISSTPVGDKNSRGIMLNSTTNPQHPPSLGKLTRQKISSLIADAPVPFDKSTAPQLDPRPYNQSSVTSSSSDPAGKQPSKRRVQRPDETPDAGADTQELLREAQARLFMTNRKGSLGQKLAPESSAGSPVEKSYRHSQRRALQQLTQESLPGTQTLLDGWNGWATVKKSRSSLGQEVKVPGSPSLQSREAHPVEDDVVRQSPPPPPPTAQPTSGRDSLIANSFVPPASAPAAMPLSGDDSAMINPPFLNHLAGKETHQDSGSDKLFHTAAELADDVFGKSVPPREAVMPVTSQ